MFSNARRVLCQCSIQLRLPYFLQTSRNGLKQGGHKFHQPRGVGITISIYFGGGERKNYRQIKEKGNYVPHYFPMVCGFSFIINVAYKYCEPGSTAFVSSLSEKTR